MSPEENAKTYIEKNAGPVLYIQYSRDCQDKQIEPVDYLKFFKLIYQTLGTIL
jgi:hypothetical protein